MTGYPLSVLPQHVALLEASAITPEVARARGYVTADSKAMLGRHGFKGYQQRAPALLIPLHHADRSTWGYQARPDEPRLTKAGKVIKYETPAGQRNGIDIPPGAPVGDPSVPLLVTEGTRKADAAVSAGLCCVALPGVWGWRGTNANGGKVAVADWNDVALGGRRVVLAFDSDVATKRQVQAALRALAAYLASKGASVEYLHLPDEGDGKTGLDDYLAARGADGIWELVRPEPPALRDGDRPLSPLEDVHTCTPPPAWASDQDILRRMVCALRVCMGLVGENRNAKLLYLAFTSRLLGEPVNIAVKGLSSSGKSYTVECVARLFPDEAIYTMTAMSERALIYLDESLAHRTVVLYEAAALRENREKAEGDMAAYVVRSLLSEGRIVYPTVIRGEDGKLRTHKITKDGPTNLVTTTTSIRLHSENETRMLSLPSNDSAAQTREVLRASSGETKRAEADLTGWHGYQRWLARANHDVVIPYAACIAEQIPPVAVRLRRDWNAVSSLIKAHAIMHQRSRETSGGQIVADLYDYTAVRSLVSDLVADAVGATVPASVRETVEAVTRLDNGFGATVAAVARELEIERSAASRRLATARDRGYLVNQEEKRGKPARYKPGEPMPGEDVLLPAPEDVCTGACTHAGLSETPVQECDCTGVCRCAGIAGGIESAGDAWAPCAPGVPAPAVAAPEVPAPAAAPLRCDAKVKKASGTSDGGCPSPPSGTRPAPTAPGTHA